MSESHVTQCPHCHTSFRVSQAQLAAAHGAVRCGACLHVFNAAQQLLASAEAAQRSSVPAKPATSTPAVTKAADDTLWIHDDLDLDGLDLDEELARLEEQERQLSQTPAPRAPISIPQASQQPARAYDEAWAEALLRDEPGKRASVEPGPDDEPGRAAATTRVTATEPDLISAEHIDEPGETLDPRLGDLHTDEQHVEPQRERDNGSATRSEPALREGQLFELDDEPLQLDWQPPASRPWGRWFAWSLLNLLAAAGLLVQYATYNFAELARQDHYRPWFEQLCPNIGCSLPTKVDIGQIRSSNLVVRSHPEFSGALIVDAILYNRAAFAQPFPLLEMRFADLGGQLVASRRFKPSEYLAGELAGQSEMPPQTPIHISLDILDPGTRAVNYSLSFHSPE